MPMGEDRCSTLDERCPCHGQNLVKLVRPALLIALAKGELCGYRVVQRLSGMPMFGGERPNASGVYRALATMAGEGLVSALWDTPAVGPAKRLYQVTPAGLACLEVWMDTLALYRDSIDDLLSAGRAVAAQRREEQPCCSGE